MKKVALFASGGGSNAEALMAAMQGDFPARPCLVFTNDPEAGVLAKAHARGVATEVLSHKGFADREGFEAEIQRLIAPYGADILCLAGFMRVLTAGFIEPWAGRMLNIHPSLLPKYRGLHTHQRALDANDAHHGCTVHEVVPELDAGPILGQARVRTLAGDDATTLAARVLKQEHILYPQVLRRFASGDRSRIDIDAS